MPERYALITGCGVGGIGEALALEFRRRRLITIATFLPHENRSHLDLDRIICLELDVTSEESVATLRKAVDKFHPLLIRAQGTIVNIGSVGGLVPYTYGSSYNASKAALHHYGNTLRVEMAPLGVKILTVISGNIGTNILKHDGQRALPEDSFYSPLASNFRAHVQRSPNTTHRSVYAKNVVSQCLKANPPTWY